jgi:hypothetical protein
VAGAIAAATVDPAVQAFIGTGAALEVTGIGIDAISVGTLVRKHSTPGVTGDRLIFQRWPPW